MKWAPDWSDIAYNLLIGLMVVAAAAIFIALCVCVWKDVTTERTNLRGANLLAADLTGADLSRADLAGANLTLAKLPDAESLKKKDMK